MKEGWNQKPDEEEGRSGVTVVHLSDEKVYCGVIRSFDAYGNLILDVACQILQDPFELSKHAFLFVGVMLIRGDSICIFGEIDGLTEHEYLLAVLEMKASFLPHCEHKPIQEIISQTRHYKQTISNAENLWNEYTSRLSRLKPTETMEMHFVKTILAK